MPYQVYHALFVVSLLSGERPPLVNDDSVVNDLPRDGERAVSDHRVGRERTFVVNLEYIGFMLKLQICTYSLDDFRKRGFRVYCTLIDTFF